MNDFESKTPDEWIGRMARQHYNPPPPTPREEIWAVVEERIRAASTEGLPGIRGRDEGTRELRARGATSSAPRFRAGWLALAASAILALGVGLGRWSRVGPAADPVAVTRSAPSAGESGRTPGARAARVAAVETLARSEPLLATVRAEASRGAVDQEVGAWARKLLGDTRFLLDSGLPLDPQVRSLLEDLELVLLQTTLVGAGTLEGPRAREELDLLRQGMDDKDVLTRIQAVVPGSQAGI